MLARLRNFRETPAELRNKWLLAGFSIRGPRTLRYVRRFHGPTTVAPGVARTEEAATARDGARTRLLRYEPEGRRTPTGALLWFHGGGFFAGSADSENSFCSSLAAELGVLVVAVDYRLAPEHPFPAALEDCHAALEWVVRQSGPLGVDRDRVAVGGASAGGGLAAAVCQVARDRGTPMPRFQLLRYPMLDDRTTTRRPGRSAVWSHVSNRYAWSCYLGDQEGAPPLYAAAARATDLTGLPPAFIGVGSADLFLEECRDYADRLNAASVPVQLHVEPGMYHAADGMMPGAGSMQWFRRREIAALREAIC